MSVPASVLVPELVRLGTTVLGVVQDVHRSAATPHSAAVATPGGPRPDDVLADVSITAQRLLTSELSARNRIVTDLNRAREREREATDAAATLARSARSAAQAAADPAAMDYITEAQSLRREIESLDGQLAQAEAQVVVVRNFVKSVEHTRTDVNRTIAGLRRDSERSQRLAELTALTGAVMERMAGVDELRRQIDTARAEVDAGWEARQGQPGVPSFIAHDRLRTAAATDELTRLYEQR